MKRPLSFVLACLAHLAPAADLAPINFKSSETRVTLLELYTSEGCSSCPPAEAWLSGTRQSPGLWRNFVPVAFHVDYWDYLGWKDAVGSQNFSDRQRAYAQAWRATTVYTPGFVVNGKEWRNWGGDIARLSSPNIKVGALAISSTNAINWQAEFTPVGKSGAQYEVHVALLRSGLVSDVKAGENSGRRLTHDFAVISLVNAALTAKDGTLRCDVTLPTVATKGKGEFAVAAWVTFAQSLEPLQSIGGWVVPAAK